MNKEKCFFCQSYQIRFKFRSPVIEKVCIKCGRSLGFGFKNRNQKCLRQIYNFLKSPDHEPLKGAGGAILKDIKNGAITVDEVCAIFREELMKGLEHSE